MSELPSAPVLKLLIESGFKNLVPGAVVVLLSLSMLLVGAQIPERHDVSPVMDLGVLGVIIGMVMLIGMALLDIARSVRASLPNGRAAK